MTDRRSESGVALAHVLLLVVMLGVFASVGMQRSQNLARDTIVDRGSLQAIHAAEGGVSQARHELGKDPDWSGGRIEIGDCEVDITVQRGFAGRYDLQVVASSRPFGERGHPVRRGMHMTLRRGADGEWQSVPHD